MNAKLNTFDETTKNNAVVLENKSLTINDLTPSVKAEITASKTRVNLPIPYGAERLNVPVCICNGFAPKIIEKTTLGDFFSKMQAESDPLSIKTAESLKKAYLSYKETSNKKAYDEQKLRLKGVVFGDYSSRRATDCLFYVGLLGIDIDGYNDTLELSFDLEHLKTNEFVFSAFPSPSGHGLRVLVWTDSTFETHKATYTNLISYLSDWLHITTESDKNPHIDGKTFDVSRLWFFTHTTDVYLNVESKVFTPSVFTPVVHIETATPVEPSKTFKRPHTHDGTLSEGDKITAVIEMSKQRNSDAQRNNFVFNTACLCVEHGISTDTMLTHFIASYAADDFTADEIKKTVNSAVKRAQFGKFTDAQLFAYVNKNNVPEEDKTPQVKKVVTPSVVTPVAPSVSKAKTVKKTVEIEENDDEAAESDTDFSVYAKIESFIQKRHDIRFNSVSRELEISKTGKNEFSHLDDFKFNDLLRQMSKAGIKASDKTLSVCLYSSFTPFYNPFKEYFDSLPKWTEDQEDHICKLASFVNAKDAYWFKTQFKKVLVRTVACSIGALPFNKQCLIFHGKQNDGKSSFIRFLCPPQLNTYIKENYKVDTDGLIALCQNFIINLDELDTLNKSDAEKIKNVFTTPNVKERLPYARTPMFAKRTASFFGSTNKSDFLTDETGNVRWLIMEIDGIKHDNGRANGYAKNVDINAVWSQAYALFNSGFDPILTDDETTESENKNQKFKRLYVELELLREQYEPAEKGTDNAFFVISTKMLETITNKTNLKLNTQLFAKALRELGFKNVQHRVEKNNGKTEPRNGYWVRENN